MAPDTETAATRRIMDQVGADTRIPYLNIDEGDVGVLVALPLIGLFAAGLFGLDAFAFPLAVLGLGVGSAVIYVTPSHLDAWTWLTDVVYYVRRPHVTLSAPATDATDELSSTVEQVANGISFTSDDCTQDLPAIRRAWPGTGAVERQDGAMEAFLEVDPGNMDFAMSDDWAGVQEAAAEFANTELEFDLKLHATTRAFPVETLIERIDDRLTDPDVQENPALQALLEEYRDRRPAEMRARGRQQVQYYLGVSVNPLDVYHHGHDEATPVERLTRLPVIGFLFNPFVTRREALSDAELRERLVAELDDRINTVRAALVQRVPGWSARRLSTAELVVLSMEFWNGEDCNSDDLDRIIRQQPAPSQVSRTGDTAADGATVEARDSRAVTASEDGSTAEPPGDDIATAHQNLVAASAIEWETRAARVGQQWTTTLYVPGYPDSPTDGYLSGLFELTDIEFDLTVYLAPKDQQRARIELQERADDLHVDADLEPSVRSVYLQEQATQAAATYAAVEKGQRVFDQAIFITVRADEKDQLDAAARRVRRLLRDAPATLTPKTAICRQDHALQSAAPIGTNVLGREVVALGAAVGAVLASPHTPTLLEPGGVEVGVHKDTQSPIVVDPFARENGYATFTVGDPGSGKSFGAKQAFVRSIEQSADRIGVILEPLNDWAGVAEALDAKRITIGGTHGLNPLEIRPTPPRVQRAMGDDASPFNEKLDDAMSFLTNFFALRGIELDDRRTTLELGLREAYARKGITEDIGTHDNESPTIRDMLDVFEAIVENPEAFVVRSADEAAKLRADATWLLDQLRPFETDGRYVNLGGPSAFDIRDETVIYLDLAQGEGSVESGTALTMQLLISLVYERAKETDKEVVFYIDEARYLMQVAASLSFLETVFRHHRHHDLSIRLVTQTVDEFFQHPEAEAILDQCAVKQFHRLDGMDDHWADEFGLNYAQMRFVQEATPGNEAAGFSEALIGVDGEWRGIHVRAMPTETQVIDFDPADQSCDELLWE